MEAFMATSFSGMALWEAMRSLRGLFSSGSADISITQQQASALLPTRDDEAIQLALDAALQGLSNGPLHLERVQSVREALEPHQRADWRVNIGSLKMTERFEQVMISKTTTRTNSASGEQPEQQDGALQQRRRGSGTRGQERTEEKFDRRQRDYEWTEEDPRIKHLILVSKLVEKGDVAKAKAYLLAAGLIAVLGLVLAFSTAGATGRGDRSRGRRGRRRGVARGRRRCVGRRRGLDPGPGSIHRLGMFCLVDGLVDHLGPDLRLQCGRRFGSCASRRRADRHSGESAQREQCD
mgnify:CR=1 FL=1